MIFAASGQKIEARKGGIFEMINANILETLNKLNLHGSLNIDELKSAFREILTSPDSSARDVLLGSLLTGLMTKGPTVEEVTALLQIAVSLDDPITKKIRNVRLDEGKVLIGMVGSGKKGIKTMNISTPSAIIAASAGAYVAKTGSSSTSSLTGSADLIRILGANIDIDTDEMIQILRQTGLGFFCIENAVPKFDRVYGQKFHVPHVLSFALAGVLSPISCDKMLYGISHPDVELAIKVLREFGISNAMVVTSTHDELHYIDEIGIVGNSTIIEMQDGGIKKPIVLSAKDFDLPNYNPFSITQAKTKEQNVQLIIDLLQGKGEKAREDIVCINAGVILYLSNISESIREGYFIAKKALKNGWVQDKLNEFIQLTQRASINQNVLSLK